MAESLRGGLSLALSGFGFWSHDIGGFEGTPTRRSSSAGSPSACSPRTAGCTASTSYRVPWDFGEEAVDVTREFTLLKHRLMPYLYAAAARGAPHGRPGDAAMLLEFPDDPAARPSTGSTCSATTCWSPRSSPTTATVEYYVPRGHLDPPADRRAGHRPGAGARAPRLRQPAAAGPPGTVLPLGSRPRPARPRPRRGGGTALLRAGGRRPRRRRGARERRTARGPASACSALGDRLRRRAHGGGAGLVALRGGPPATRSPARTPPRNASRCSCRRPGEGVRRGRRPAHHHRRRPPGGGLARDGLRASSTTPPR